MVIPLPYSVAQSRFAESELLRPYILPMVTVKIGEKSYGVPSQYLRKFPQLGRDWSLDPCLVLSDMHEDAGHTVVNFLYTGTYETTRSTFDQETSPIAREFRRSVFVYQASRTYDLPELKVLAKKYLVHFSDSMEMFDIVTAARDVFQKLPRDEVWFPSYIKEHLKQSLAAGRSVLNMHEISSITSEDHFGTVFVRMVLDIFAACLHQLENIINGNGELRRTLHTEGVGIGEVPVSVREDYPAPRPQVPHSKYYALEEPVVVSREYPAPDDAVPASGEYPITKEPVPPSDGSPAPEEGVSASGYYAPEDPPEGPVVVTQEYSNPEEPAPVSNGYPDPEEPALVPETYPAPEEPVHLKKRLQVMTEKKSHSSMIQALMRA